MTLKGSTAWLCMLKSPAARGEGNVREGFRGADRFRGPRKGAGVIIGKSELGGVGAKATGRGINIEVENICRRGRAHWKYSVEGQKTQGNIKSNRGFGGGGAEGLKTCKTGQEAPP